jgi:hypothetical protein
MFVESQKENKLGKEALLDAILAKPTEAEARRNTYEETLTEPQLSFNGCFVRNGPVRTPWEISTSNQAIFDLVQSSVDPSPT